MRPVKSKHKAKQGQQNKYLDHLDFHNCVNFQMPYATFAPLHSCGIYREIEGIR